MKIVKKVSKGYVVQKPIEKEIETHNIQLTILNKPWLRSAGTNV